MGGPRYHFDPNLDSERKFPAFYDDKWFIAEWNNGWIKTANLGPTGAMTAVDPFALGTGYRRPMDLDFGPDGALYVIEWGSGFGGDNADSGIYRVDYVAGNKAPIAEATASVTSGLAPLAVQFNSTGSGDPDGGPITYAWDFDSDGTVDSTAAEPRAHVHGERRLHGQAHRARRGRPQRRREHPDHGRQPRADGDDRDAARTASSRPSRTRSRTRSRSPTPRTGRPARASPATDLTVKISLGHDEHAHDLSTSTGCEGTLNSGPGRRARAGGQHVHGHLGGLHRQGRPALALTGRAEAILQPKQKQAEFFASTGRVAGRDDRRHRRRADRDHHGRRGRRVEHRLHRGRRLHVLQAVQPDRHLRGSASGWRAPARAARSSSATTRRPARCWARRR